MDQLARQQAAQEEHIGITAYGYDIQIYPDGRVFRNKEELGPIVAAAAAGLAQSGQPITTAYSAADLEILKEQKIGAELSDGTIYVGVREDGQHVMTTPRMLPRMANHYDALKTPELMQAQGVSDHGHKDWALPNSEEGRLLYAAKGKGKLKGTFAKSEFTDGYQGIWLAEHDINNARDQWFDDGAQNGNLRDTKYAVRPVRRCNHLTL